MKSKQSKEAIFSSNKSGVLEKRNSNLIIQTQLDNTFDIRWAEIKIQGKNILSRSNHASVVFSSFLFVHGGYDVDKGVIDDFNMIDLSQECEEYVWKKLDNTCNGKVIKLKNHSAILSQESMIIYGGETHTSCSSDIVYIYDLVTKKWRSVAPNHQKSKDSPPQLDSHCAVLWKNKMIIYGGYMTEKAQYLKNIYAFDLTTNSWELFYESNKKSSEEQPEGRSNFAMVLQDNDLIMFGGSNGLKTLCDMWKFNLQKKEWQKIITNNTPEPRRGHSLIQHEGLIFMFGGIQDITKEKNDVYIYEPASKSWSKIHTTTNSVYDCSPTLKKSNYRNTQKNHDLISPVRISPEKNSNSGEFTMKKILSENKQKKFLERKRELLKQFTQNPNQNGKKKRQFSPTTESMVKTLEALGNQESNKREVRQEIIYDESHRFIMGKKPCARDGQSVNMFQGKMFIFGGDRHLMAFNDLYKFDLSKGVKSLDFYKSQ